MIVLKILGALLLLLILLLCFTVTMEAAYEKEVTLRIRWLFFRVGILPAKKKAEKEEKSKKSKKTKEKKAEEKTKPKKKMTLDDILSILELVKLALEKLGSPLGWFLRRIRYRDLWLHALICQSDAHQTALRYGQCQAFLHGILTVLRNDLDLTVKELIINADFIGEEESFSGGGQIRLRPIYLLIFLFWFGGSFGIAYLKERKQEKKLRKELKAQCALNTEPTERKD